MSLRRPAGAAIFALTVLLWSASASAQDLMLPPFSEVGFLQLIHMAQTGQLGEDVTNANVEVFKTWVQVELVRAEAPTKLLRLTPKSSTQTICRYFNIEAGEGATTSDVERVGKALDEVFAGDPFQLDPGFFDEPPGGEPIPRLADVWQYGGWRGVLRVLERRTTALASLGYTIAVIVVVSTVLLASLLLLWGSERPCRNVAG